jgi:hypothetical protein
MGGPGERERLEPLDLEESRELLVFGTDDGDAALHRRSLGAGSENAHAGIAQGRKELLASESPGGARGKEDADDGHVLPPPAPVKLSAARR